MLDELWSLQGRYRTLHLTWFAFFLTFVVWFNLAPLATTVRISISMTAEPFPPEETGLAEGIDRGWETFGSPFSALTRVAVRPLLPAADAGPPFTAQRSFVFSTHDDLLLRQAQ